MGNRRNYPCYWAILYTHQPNTGNAYAIRVDAFSHVNIGLIRFLISVHNRTALKTNLKRLR